MIFDREQAHRLVTGGITQLRLPIRSTDPPLTIGKPIAVQPGLVEREVLITRGYHAGTTRTRAVAARAIGRILPVRVDRQQLADATADDARREGHKTRAELIRHWHDHGQADTAICWLISVQPERAQAVRLLTRGPGNDGRGYTDKPHLAMTDEPEAVDDATLEQFAIEANTDRKQRTERIAADRERQELETRLANVRAEARNAGIDISRQEASIAARISALERRVRRRAA